MFFVLFFLFIFLNRLTMRYFLNYLILLLLDGLFLFLCISRLFWFHSTTFDYFYFFSGLVITVSWYFLHLVNNVHTQFYSSKNYMFIVKPWCFCKSDKELRAICILTSICRKIQDIYVHFQKGNSFLRWIRPSLWKSLHN